MSKKSSLEQPLSADKTEYSKKPDALQERAKDLVGEIKGLKKRASTVEDYTRLANLYKQIAELYSPKIELSQETVRNYEILSSVYDKHGIAEFTAGEKKWEIPTKEEITEAIKENKELFELKQSQGLTEVLIVPEGIEERQHMKILGAVLLESFDKGELNDSQGNKITEIDRTNPVWFWDGLDNLVYYPKKFDKNNHQGKTKEQLLEEQGGWQIRLAQPGEIPRQGQGNTINGRKIPEAGNSPNEYLETSNKAEEDPNSPYCKERGMTPNEWMSYAILTIVKTCRVPDDHQGKGSVCYLTGAYNLSSGCVPCGYWNRAYRQANVGRTNPDSRFDNCGVRPAVRIYRKP